MYKSPLLISKNNIQLKTKISKTYRGQNCPLMVLSRYRLYSPKKKKHPMKTLGFA